LKNSTLFPFVFVTRSPEKRAEVERILDSKLRSQSIDLPEIQAIEVEKVVGFKARLAYEQLDKQPVMIEDTGLYFEAWDGLPGALIKWFIKHVGPDGICRMMETFPNRRAYAKTIVATYDGELHAFKGTVNGRIAKEPAGEHGFGWDMIFIPNEDEKTFAEMSLDEKNRYSMRRIALEEMRSFYSM
jgi:non-canonical purine NTP pyrophosphatase (RdgB/HAM1 family)